MRHEILRLTQRTMAVYLGLAIEDMVTAVEIPPAHDDARAGDSASAVRTRQPGRGVRGHTGRRGLLAGRPGDSLYILRASVL